MKKKLALTALSCLMFNQLSFAGSPYLSGQVGYFNTDYISDNGFAARISAGYLWNATKRIHLGLETGLTGFEKKNIEIYIPGYYTFRYYQPGYYEYADNQRVALDLAGVFDFYVTKRFDIFLKLGGGYQWNHTTHTTLNYDSNIADGGGVKFAIGLGYNITPHLNINLERSVLTGKDSGYIENTNNTFGITMLGVRYTFCPKKDLVSEV